MARRKLSRSIGPGFRRVNRIELRKTLVPLPIEWNRPGGSFGNALRSVPRPKGIFRPADYSRPECALGKKVGGLLLPGALPNRTYVRCLGGSSECNGIIVSTCVWPVTAEPYRAKTAPLPRPSILVRPHRLRPRRCGGEMVEAPGTAP